MANRQSHVLQEQTAAWDGRPFIDWLNKKRGTKDYTWTVQLLNDLNWLRRARIPAAEFDGPSNWIPPEDSSLVPLREWGKRHREIRRKLGRFKMGVELTSIGNLKAVPFSFDWNPGKNPRAKAVLRMVRLGQQGVLDRVQQCLKCETWFFARFRHQRFCSVKCQQSHYKSSEAWKAHRREWARVYYSNNCRKKRMPNIK